MAVFTGRSARTLKKADAIVSRSGSRAGTLWLDNVAKLVCDALNGICWADDAQVATISGQKEYGGRPRLDVTVTVLISMLSGIVSIAGLGGFATRLQEFARRYKCNAFPQTR